MIEKTRHECALPRGDLGARQTVRSHLSVAIVEGYRSAMVFHKSRSRIRGSRDRGASKVGLLISVFGLGYVGSVSAACFASMGHRVIGVDVNPAKVEMMESGKSPIVEASMNELVAEVNRSCRLHATV